MPAVPAPGRIAPWLAPFAVAASLLLLRPVAEARRPPRIDVRLDVPGIPADIARPLAFGFRSLVGDLVLLEAIQLHGGRREQTLAEGGGDDRAMARLLDYATDLDPLFAGAYRFAGNALIRHTTDGKATNVFAAEQILRKSLKVELGDWRIPFFLGFIQSFYLNHNEDAAESLRLASRSPGAPGYVGLLATRLASEAGNLAMARQFAIAMAAQAPDDEARAQWEERLADIEMETDLRNIEAAVARHIARTGKPPGSLAALVAAGDLHGLPREPHGGKYVLDAAGQPSSTASRRLKLTHRDDRWGMEVH